MSVGDPAMDCEEAYRAINEALDGRVTQAEEESLAAHLLSCETCRRARREMTSIASAEAARPMESPGESFAAIVTARAVESRRPASFWKPLIIVSAAAAAAASSNAVINGDIVIAGHLEEVLAVCRDTFGTITIFATELLSAAAFFGAAAVRACGESLAAMAGVSDSLAVASAACAAAAMLFSGAAVVRERVR
jgi:predicted anti-sigma-YlaC factor YlaD